MAVRIPSFAWVAEVTLMPTPPLQLRTDRGAAMEHDRAGMEHDRAGQLRRQAQEDVSALRALGVAFVELITTEDLAVCPACRGVARRTYATDTAPLPPVAGCAVGCRCMIAPLFLE